MSVRITEDYIDKIRKVAQTQAPLPDEDYSDAEQAFDVPWDEGYRSGVVEGRAEYARELLTAMGLDWRPFV